MDETRSAYPLEWPDGWPRTSPGRRSAGKFNKKETVSNGTSSYPRSKPLSIIDALGRILTTLGMMGINRNDVVISTNMELRLDGLPRTDRRAPEDPGAAVYWRDRAASKPLRAMAIDRYFSLADNLAAIAATLDAMRAIERHGGAEILDRAFSGFLALPAKASTPWREVLGLDKEVFPVSREQILVQSRNLLLRHNPDTGGDRDRYEEIIEARKLGLAEVGGGK